MSVVIVLACRCCARVIGPLCGLEGIVDCDTAVVPEASGLHLSDNGRDPERGPHRHRFGGGSQGSGSVRTVAVGMPELPSHSNPALSEGRSSVGSLRHSVNPAIPQYHIF